MSENPNPFEGIEACFAADLEPVRHDFQMHKQSCFVTLRPMDASAEARFRSRGQSFVVDTTKQSIESVKVDTDQDELELELLLGTVVDYALARRKPFKGTEGGFLVEVTNGESRSPHDRRADFRALAPQFRKRLVALCCEVNSLAPLAGSWSGNPASTPSSTTSKVSSNGSESLAPAAVPIPS